MPFAAASSIEFEHLPTFLTGQGEDDLQRGREEQDGEKDEEREPSGPGREW